MFLSIMLANAQIPTPLATGDFPQPNDSSAVIEYTIPPTQSFPDSTSANDSLSIDRTLEKSLQAITDFFMDDVATGGNQNDTVPLVIYSQLPGTNSFHRLYLAPNAFSPGQSSFPTATVFNYLETPDGPAYVYYINEASGFYELGSYLIPTGQPAMTMINTPRKPIATFPLDYNTPANVSGFTCTSAAGGISTVSHLNVTVDAYGDLVVVSGSGASPIYTTYSDYLRTVMSSLDTMDLGSGMFYYIESKFYNYYIPGQFDPIIVYSVAKIRTNIDPAYWSMAGQWEDEIEVQYNKKIIVSGLEEQEANFNIFPNPSNGQVSLNMTAFADENVLVEVFDIAGNMVHSGQYMNGLVNFDMSDQAAGMYIVKISAGDYSFNSKLILQ